MAVENSDARRLFASALVVLLAAGLFSVLLVSDVRGDVSGAAFASSSDIPAGYSPPWNIFADDAPFLTVAVGDATSGAVPITVSASQQGMIFYKYYYVSENGAWQQYAFPQVTISGSGWIAENASANTTLDLSSLTDGSDNYVLVYGCTKVDGAWQCGCSSPTTCNLWSIQDFTKPSLGLPACPSDPLCVGKADGDTFCMASRPSQVYTCTADADGCLVARSDACAADSSCAVSNGTASHGIASCVLNTIHPCDQVQPSGDNYACGTTNLYTLCGNAINITGTHCDAGTCQGGSCVGGNFTYCSAASRNARACTDNYSPVCGTVETSVECFAAPCPTVNQYATYSNACNACLDANVTGYTDGPCSAQPSCSSNAGCDDSNLCTTDTCSVGGACQHTDVADGTACTSSSATGTCRAGTCVVTPGPSACAAPNCLDPLTDDCVAELGVGNVSDGVGQVCVDGAWGPSVPTQ